MAETNSREFLVTMLDGFVKVQLPFDMPFDKLTVLSKVEGLTALSKAEGLRCAASFSLLRTVSTSHSRICAP